MAARLLARLAAGLALQAVGAAGLWVRVASRSSSGGAPHPWMYDVLGKGAGRVRTIGDVYEWDQTRSQGLVIEVDHPRLGRLELPGPPVRFDEATVQAHRAPPALGEHTEEVLQWLRSG